MRYNSMTMAAGGAAGGAAGRARRAARATLYPLIIAAVGLVTNFAHPAFAESRGIEAALSQRESITSALPVATLASSAGLISAGFIAAGMSFQQVLKALGPAPDKVEYEASRRNIWHYNDGQVVFKEGQVVKLNTGTQSGVEIPVPAQRPMSPAVVKDPKVSKEAERVLLDILKEIPSGSESPFDPNSGVPAPGTPLTPQPLHMNHGAMPFGGISGGGYDDMAE